MQVLLAAGAAPEAECAGGYTPLHRAAEAGAVEAVRVLAANGAPLNARTRQGCTPIHLAATQVLMLASAVCLHDEGDQS